MCTQGVKAQIIGPEEEDEDGDGYAINEVRRCLRGPISCLCSKSRLSLCQMDGPFQDIELLKSRPAHMTVFMRYVFTQLLDPNPLVSPPPFHFHNLREPALV